MAGMRLPIRRAELGVAAGRMSLVGAALDRSGRRAPCQRRRPKLPYTKKNDRDASQQATELRLLARL